jgi:hypothetical protein
MDSMVSYLGVELDDALTISETIDRSLKQFRPASRAGRPRSVIDPAP